MSFKLEVFGDYALFTRPEMKAERVSYDVMTPSAARGILEAIFWHPGIRWKVDRIYVMSPICFSNICRNEVPDKISGNIVRTAVRKGKEDSLYYCCKEHRTEQRTAMVLRHVRYVIEAHFEMTEKANPTDNAGKFCEMFRRRAQNGQCYHQPCFGTREFPAAFRLWEGGDIPTAYPDSEKDLGFMLYDMDYSDPENIKPMFFRAVLKNGVLDLTEAEVYQ